VAFAGRTAAAERIEHEGGHRDILDVRHEVVAVVVSRCLTTTTPAVLPAVSYRDGRRGQLWGPKLPEERSLARKGGGSGRES
jgi:hypothetical protein